MAFNWFLPKTRRVKCPDGTVKTVYRDLDDIYPLHLDILQKTMEGDLHALEAEAKVKHEVVRSVHGLLIRLDRTNANALLDLRSAYSLYQSDPCGNADFYRQAVEKVRDTQHAMALHIQKVESLIKLTRAGLLAPDEFGRLILRIYGYADEPRAARQEIAEAREIAAEWTKSKNGNHD